MRALFLKHDHTSPETHIGDQFIARGFSIDSQIIVPEESFTKPSVNASFPDPANYDVIVTMGAPWSVYDTDLIDPWVTQEQHYLKDVFSRDIPIFGICFGGQILAKSLGGDVVPSDVTEIGYYRIDSDRPELVAEGPWFEWHNDRWVPPSGAEVIARTESAQQAYVIGRSLGVQFHPEVTQATYRDWLPNGGDVYLKHHGVDPDELDREIAAHDAENAARGRVLVDAFLDQVAFPK